MIKIECERELIQFDIIDFNTDKEYWGAGDTINCHIYFTKFDCQFTSKNVVINYNVLKQFHIDLKLLINNKKDHALLIDQNNVVSLNIHHGKKNFPNLRKNDEFKRLIEFEFFYYIGSDISLKGYLFVDDNSLIKTLEEIKCLL
ncbi:unnamed protein product [Commensalibacter communis]|uniref:hypothetical protein n=1 Tax=Commensalibacter communis TaxID=2972786 RepID=UPI0022FF90A5|nr:hypothetical protein [Commensalibacter communis]CAI3929452.1 unnamed protein product [Commensalibacter communis]CAI3929823.1 unnamed protein product [Commensalibacter communis]